MSLGPMVSCVLPTGGRTQFLRQALRCYGDQHYPHRELIIVDDGSESFEAELPGDASIRYLHLPCRMALGAKLNLAIEQSQGEVIQKLDDDDYYRPEFLGRMVQALGNQDQHRIAALDCFLVLIASTGYLAKSGHGWVAGNSLCFPRALWKRRAFRAVERAEDWWFLRDHAGALARVCEPELSVVVRHDFGHTWTHCGVQSVTERFTRCPPHEKSLASIVSREAMDFYMGLRR